METNRRGLVGRKWIIAILVYAGLIAICCIALYAVPSLRGMLEKTYIAEYGKIDVNDEVSAFIVRDETVYVAAQDSNINRLAEEDRLVRSGTRVVELTPTESAKKEAEEEAAEEAQKAAEAEAAKAEGGEEAAKPEEGGKTEEAAAPEEPEDEKVEAGKYTKIIEELGDTVIVTEDGSNQGAGYVSYYVDGAEARLSTAAVESLTYDDLKSLTGRKAVKVPDKKCGKGYPVFKVVRNSKWYLVFYLSNKDAEKYEAGDTVSVDINGEKVDVTVSSVESGSKNTRIILVCKSFFEGFFEIRNLDTTITVASAEGLVLEDSSIVEAPDGKRGVFVKNKLGEHVFKPVRAKADDGTQCVVYSDIYVDNGGNFVETIGTYDEIIAEPTEEDIASLKKTNPAKPEGNS